MKKIKISNLFDHLNEWKKITKVDIKSLPQDLTTFLKEYVLPVQNIKLLSNKGFYSYTKEELERIIPALSKESSINKTIDFLTTEDNINKYLEFIGIDVDSKKEIDDVLNKVIIPNFKKNNIDILPKALKRVKKEFDVHPDEPEYYYEQAIAKGEEFSDDAAIGIDTEDTKIEYQVLFISYLLNMVLCGQYTDSLVDEYVLPEFDNESTEDTEPINVNNKVKVSLLDVCCLSRRLSMYLDDNSQWEEIFNEAEDYPFNDSLGDLFLSLNYWSQIVFNYDLVDNYDNSQYNPKINYIRNIEDFQNYFKVFVGKFKELSNNVSKYVGKDYQESKAYPFTDSLDIELKKLKAFQKDLEKKIYESNAELVIYDAFVDVFQNWVRLSDNWEDELNTDKYPFELSFDEYCPLIRDWLQLLMTDAMIDKPRPTIQSSEPKQILKFLMKKIKDLGEKLENYKEKSGNMNYETMISNNPFVPMEFKTWKEMHQKMLAYYNSIN